MDIQADIIIFGGGITGLWLLNRAREAGYEAILFEKEALGAGQTHKAQGIIHGGMKFALQGVFNTASQSIADMPAIWRACLNGTGEINLREVPILSSHQYLFSTGKLAGRLTGFFANVALQGRMTALQSADYPNIFQHAKFKGLVYALDEIAIDVHALIQALAKPYASYIFKMPASFTQNLQKNAEGLYELQVETVSGKKYLCKAAKLIFAAGTGNEAIVEKLGKKELATQRRPLHMVMMKTDFTYPVFAHCFGVGATPRITITTTQAKDGKTIWYLGGQIAEEGVNRDEAAQQAFAKRELASIFPWLDFSSSAFASFFVDRAEPKQVGGKRPDSDYYFEDNNLIIAWPTKLALAPALANRILQGIKKSSNPINFSALEDFSKPDIAKPLWEILF